MLQFTFPVEQDHDALLFPSFQQPAYTVNNKYVRTIAGYCQVLMFSILYLLGI